MNATYIYFIAKFFITYPLYPLVQRSAGSNRLIDEGLLLRKIHACHVCEYGEISSTEQRTQLHSTGVNGSQRK